ncbi:MAG: hypothetical protein DLM66_00340 [Candidatus Dormiibacter spiritus]|nr:MAG: hypothetical protein DLM66_00340 [Candidatus Dormibacteraeota bacterium]
MGGYSINVDTKAFDAALPAAIDELEVISEGYVVGVADKVVALAKGFAPKGKTLRLEAAIHAEAPQRTPRGIEIDVGTMGSGVREDVYMEFGTYKDAPRAFMRKALAIAAGASGAAVYAAPRGSMLARRLRARAHIRKQMRRGQMTPAVARLASYTVSQRLRTRRRRTP